MKADRFRYLREILAVTCLALGACSPLPDCDQNIRDQIVSPDGLMKAALLDMQCGATTADATWVLMTASSKKFDVKKDNIAVFEGRVDIRWEKKDLVVVYGDSVPSVMIKNKDQTSIRYEGVSAPAR